MPSVDTQFKPGNPGGPGRPPGVQSLKSLLRKRLAELAAGDKAGRTYAQALVDKTLLAAMDGDAQARKLCWEYIDGKPHQTLELSVRTYDEYSEDELDAEEKRLAEEESRVAAELRDAELRGFTAGAAAALGPAPAESGAQTAAPRTGAGKGAKGKGRTRAS